MMSTQCTCCMLKAASSISKELKMLTELNAVRFSLAHDKFMSAELQRWLINTSSVSPNTIKPDHHLEQSKLKFL